MAKSGRRRGQTKRDQLSYLMLRHGNRCVQCRGFVVTHWNVQRRRKGVLRVDSDYYVEWRTPWGAIARARIATIEHKKRLADGGDYRWSNLTLLCRQCNHENNLALQRYENSLKRREKARCRQSPPTPSPAVQPRLL